MTNLHDQATLLPDQRTDLKGKQGCCSSLYRFLYDGSDKKDRPYCGIFTEFVRFFVLSYFGFVRLCAYDPQVLILLTYTYIIEIFLWSVPLLLVIFANRQSFLDEPGSANYNGDDRIFKLNQGTTILLIITTVLEGYSLYRITSEAEKVDWGKFGD